MLIKTLTEDSNKSNRNELQIYVFNGVEDEWSFLSAINDPIKRFEHISELENATDAYFLSLATEKDFVYISPKPISQEFQDYAQSLLHFQKSRVITPTLRSHLICEDLLADSKSFNELVTLAKEYKKILMTSYSASFEFYSLYEQLLRVGLDVSIPEAPDYASAWTVNFFGSKSGIRQLAQKSRAQEPDFMMPEGVICMGKQDAAKIAANRYLKNKGVVIKTNKGSGGNGVLIFRDGELPTVYRDCVKKILDSMEERYWDIYPVIIEDLVNIHYNGMGGFPNVEFRIHKNGRIEMLYVCACQVTSKGVFYGIDINEDIINDRLQTRMEDTGYFIAEQYAADGYRGYFDIDMMYAKNGHVYVCESNTRHTGGTDVYKMAKALLGKNFMTDGYTISRIRHGWFEKDAYSFSDILETLSELLYDSKKREGIVINSHHFIRDGGLIYTIIGKNKKKAYELEKTMVKLLSSLKKLGSSFDNI